MGKIRDIVLKTARLEGRLNDMQRLHVAKARLMRSAGLDEESLGEVQGILQAEAAAGQKAELEIHLSILKMLNGLARENPKSTVIRAVMDGERDQISHIMAHANTGAANRGVSGRGDSAVHITSVPRNSRGASGGPLSSNPGLAVREDDDPQKFLQDVNQEGYKADSSKKREDTSVAEIMDAFDDPGRFMFETGRLRAAIKREFRGRPEMLAAAGRAYEGGISLLARQARFWKEMRAAGIKPSTAARVARAMARADPGLAAASPAVRIAAHYPWDECVADQKADGKSKESADKICGSIKAKNARGQKRQASMFDIRAARRKGMAKTAAGKFDESKHKRADDGKFTSGGGSPGTTKSAPAGDGGEKRGGGVVISDGVKEDMERYPDVKDAVDAIKSSDLAKKYDVSMFSGIYKATEMTLGSGAGLGAGIIRIKPSPYEKGTPGYKDEWTVETPSLSSNRMIESRESMPLAEVIPHIEKVAAKKAAIVKSALDYLGVKGDMRKAIGTSKRWNDVIVGLEDASGTVGGDEGPMPAVFDGVKKYGLKVKSVDDKKMVFALPKLGKKASIVVTKLSGGEMRIRGYGRDGKSLKQPSYKSRASDSLVSMYVEREADSIAGLSRGERRVARTKLDFRIRRAAARRRKLVTAPPAGR